MLDIVGMVSGTRVQGPRRQNISYRVTRINPTFRLRMDVELNEMYLG